MKQNKRIAITGGMASGKSTVASIINGKGYKVFSCDEIYAELLESGRFEEKLKKAFGKDIYAGGSLDRKKLGEIIYADEEKRKTLDGITHPEIMKELFAKTEGCALSFCEVPLLFEGGFESCFDGVIVVLRDKDKRLSAISKKYGIDKKAAEKRINSQFNYEFADFAKYYVIHNNADIVNLEIQICKILDIMTGGE